MHKATLPRLAALLVAAGLPLALAAAQPTTPTSFPAIAPPPVAPGSMPAPTPTPSPSPASKSDAAAPDTTGSPRVEVVFVLDTTGSMGGLIDGAQKKIWSIANAIATCKPAPKLKVGLVAYRDRGDAYVTQVTGLTDDLDAIYTKLMALKADGGGDGPESVNQALHEAVTKIDWSPVAPPVTPGQSAASSAGGGVLRIVYLVGDAPPHMDYPDDIKHADSCTLAMKKGLIINTIQCGGDETTLPIWQSIARASEGAYFKIAQQGGVIAISTPHDEALIKLNADVEKTMLDYGNAGDKEMMHAKRTSQSSVSYDLAASTAPAAAKAAGADRAVYNTSSAGWSNLYGRQELVNDVDTQKVKLADIPEKDLPESLKPMTPEQRESFIKAQSELRKSLTTQIADLAAKRDTFIKGELAKQGSKADSFDDSVIAAFRSQAAVKGVKFEEKK